MGNEIEQLNRLIKAKKLTIAKSTSGERLILNRGKIISLSASNHAIREIFLSEYNKFLGSSDVQTLRDYLEIIPLPDNVPTYNEANRIYMDSEKLVYELEQESGKCVVITKEEARIDIVTDVLFKHPADFEDQCEPDFNSEPDDIFDLIHKHFNMKNKNQEKLLILYLATALLGSNIAFPVLNLIGEQGSSKSTTLRKINQILDPKKGDLCGLPKGVDGLELRLANTYFVALDNLSKLSKTQSDVLARSVTGGTITKRKLYTDSEEIVLNIKALIALNGISLVTQEADLLDRCLILELDRIEPDKMKTEKEVWDEFNKDKPKILGALFTIILNVFSDDEKIHIPKLIRLSDFHMYCVRVGKIIGLSEEEVSQLLWDNKKIANNYSISEDIVATCMIELMSRRNNYKNSMGNLLHDLNEIALNNAAVSSVLPKTPNHLTTRINKVKSLLASEYGITYHIQNVGAFKEIRIEKR